MSIIYFIVIGLIIGALARLLLPGRQKIGIILTLLLGVAGALIGGIVANALGTGRIGNMNAIGFIVAVLAAVASVADAQAPSGARRGRQDRAQRLAGEGRRRAGPAGGRANRPFPRRGE